ncbi:MAG TPA: PQQ-dependent sugar dehydrogenase [Methylomirabilota bacterium]|nr:PQQ-dependent sugar dehydrogenase [Methylomirabilota bacterium]
MKYAALVGLLALAGSAFAADKPTGPPSGPQQEGNFHKVILDSDKDTNGDGQYEDTIKEPMELAVAPDGRVFFNDLYGSVRMWDPKTSQTKEIANIKVYHERNRGMEDGMLGLTLDPNFAKNNWIYLFYSTPETKQDSNGKKTGENLLSRFTLKGDQLDLSSEKVLLRVQTQRETCCHQGGSLAFDKDGNLYISTGDNTNPFESHGFAPTDERPGRSPWDAQKSSANPNDLRGKILRIHPAPDGTYTIPKGNLFAVGTEGTRPEIFVMGNRNPYRIGLDSKTGFLYWGEVGPDAGGPSEKRGPAGFDEINQAREAGFYGWPYFIADNKAYVDFDFATTNSGAVYNASAPINDSPYNTGRKELPPAKPAMIYYPASASTRFPVVGSGGRTAMAGPVYHFDENLKSDRKLPREYDNTLFIYEWSRNWIIAVKLDENSKVVKMEPFLKGMTFKRPVDMELGPDGCLYIIEYGTNWGNNTDTQIVRIEHRPSTQASAN